MTNVPPDIKLNEPSDNICKMSANLPTSPTLARKYTDTDCDTVSCLQSVSDVCISERQFSTGQTGQTELISETNDCVIVVILHGHSRKMKV